MTHTHTRLSQRRRRPVGGVLVAGLALLLLLAPGAGAQQPLGALMQDKLDRAQQLFEAVVLGRFPAIERHARALQRLSEDSAWMPSPSSTFLTHAAEFQEAARDLQAAAAEGDMDDVSSAYMTLVGQCVQCHRHVRDSRRVDRRP